MRDALQSWLAPALPIDEVAGGGKYCAQSGKQSGAQSDTQSGALEFLLRRMRHKSDFPALCDSIARIQRVTHSVNPSLGSLSGEILKDVALANKLLRLVNTSHYSPAGGSISTVSPAVALIGFSGVRNMAMSLVLLEHMHDKAHANQLKEDNLRSLMAGMLASELGTQAHDSEAAFIGAMFQNLGRMLAEFYFPEEARQVRGMVAASGAAGVAGTGGALVEESASSSVLGMSFEALGVGVARSWGLPPALQGCMRKPRGEPPAHEPKDAGERLRWLSFASNQITDALLHSAPEQARAQVAKMARRYARTLGVDPARIEAAAETARLRLVQMARVVNLRVAAQSPARRLLEAPPAQAGGGGCADAARGRRFTAAARLAGHRDRAAGRCAVGARERCRGARGRHPGHHEFDG